MGPPEESDPHWADEDRLDWAFSRWFPGEAAPDDTAPEEADAPAAEPAGPAPHEGDGTPVADELAPAPTRQEWARGDDDVLPPRRRRRWRRS